jgi:hypothetical protein
MAASSTLSITFPHPQPQFVRPMLPAACRAHKAQFSAFVWLMLASLSVPFPQALHITSLRAWSAEITAQALDLYEGIAKVRDAPLAAGRRPQAVPKTKQACLLCKSVLLVTASCRQPAFKGDDLLPSCTLNKGLPSIGSSSSSCLQELMVTAGGYLISATDGLILAAFPTLPSTAPALRWALSCVRACLHAAWPQELLEHELGE